MSRKLTALSSLKAKLEIMDQSEFPTPQSCCIYRVPPQLREVNEAAYTPMMVSIGPFHHGNKRLSSMEEFKLWFLKNFLKRTQGTSFDNYDNYVHVLRNQEIKIRRCYSEIIPMGSDEFIRMILTDACFIIEYFLLWIDEDEDCLHPKLWSFLDIKRDLILLENQLPFFVLRDLFDLTYPNGDNHGRSIEFVTYRYFDSAFMFLLVPNKQLREKFTFSYFVQHHLPRLPDGTPHVYHLCDMLRICYVRLDQLPRERNDNKLKHVYSACKLHDAGIKFEVNADEISLLKLQYSKGVLKIPEVMISDSTETLLRNVAAFEQFQFRDSRSMIDYIIFLEHFIRSEKDVEILEENRVIQNNIGENDAVASITKRLGMHTKYVNYNNDYISLFKELNEICDSPCQRYIEIFKQQYWSTPWRIASFLGAIFLLFLTLIQTISSVFAFFQN
ncbi:hypothetical protein QN277_019730 [Acacia crassicarpa]|uniref:Uncharacterized protein n=1 Tax=Acacia crassicarpa TaxID=499986 RepID=A0AAE1MKB6_9FABA|nr:hypothetical protein QN277_019730 [Acacia crassicarpa]